MSPVLVVVLRKSVCITLKKWLWRTGGRMPRSCLGWWYTSAKHRWHFTECRQPYKKSMIRQWRPFCRDVRQQAPIYQLPGGILVKEEEENRGKGRFCWQCINLGGKTISHTCRRGTGLSSIAPLDLYLKQLKQTPVAVCNLWAPRER